MTHFLADDGEKIHLKISGEGKPLIFLHGWTSNHQEWFSFLPELQKNHTVYRWDARGHGGHKLLTNNPPTVIRMAQDLSNLLENYELNNVVVIGHSMGALTLWQYIRDFGTTRLGKICIIDQSPKLLTDESWNHGIYGNFETKQANQLISLLQEDFAEGVLRLTAYGLNKRARDKFETGSSGWEKARQALRSQEAGPLIKCWQSLTEADYRDVLKKTNIPTMLVFGEESNFYHVETAHYVQKQIPNAILHIYEGTDHSPHQWHRERFTRDLISFINEEN